MAININVAMHKQDNNKKVDFNKIPDKKTGVV